MPLQGGYSTRTTSARQKASAKKTASQQRLDAAKKQAQGAFTAARARKPVPMPGYVGPGMRGPGTAGARPLGTTTMPTDRVPGNFSVAEAPVVASPSQASFVGQQPATGGFSLMNADTLGNLAGALQAASPGGVTYDRPWDHGATNAAGTVPMTGWAAQQGLTPTGLDALQREPADIIAMMLGQGAAGTPLYGMMAPLADDVNALNLLINGQGAGLASQSANEAVNWMAEFFRNQMTPGGQVLGVNNLLGAMLGAQGVDSPLSAFLNVDADPNQAVRNFMSLAAAVGDAGMNPLMAQAMMAQLGAQGTEFRNQVNQGVNVPFTRFLADRQAGF